MKWDLQSVFTARIKTGLEISNAEGEPGRVEDLLARSQISQLELLPELMAGKIAAVCCK